MAQLPHHPDADDGLDQSAVDRIVRQGARGAVAVAGVATVIVVAIVIAFYLFIYLPRGIVQ